MTDDGSGRGAEHPPLRRGPSAVFTRRGGHRHFAPSDLLICAFAFGLGPAVVGFVLILVLGTDPLGWDPAWHWVGDLGPSLVFGSLPMLVVSPVVLAVFALLLRVGLAGWAVMAGLVLIAAIVTTVASDDGFLFWVVVTALHAGSLWGCAVRTEPDAFTRER